MNTHLTLITMWGEISILEKALSKSVSSMNGDVVKCAPVRSHVRDSIVCDGVMF